MSNSIYDILNSNTFNCLDKGTKNQLIGLYKEIQGKSLEDSLPYLIAYSKKIKTDKCTKMEKDAMIQIFLTQLSDNDRTKMKSIMKMLNL